MNAIILAGGLSSRMGADKSLLPFAGVPLARRVVELFRPHVEDVILVVSDPRPYSDFGVTVVTDVLPRRGPLGGLYTGLLHSRADLNVVAACDMPFASPALAARLAALAEGYDAVVPVFRGRREPLHAIYRRACLPAAEGLLNGGGAAGLTDLLDRLRVNAVDVEELDADGRLAMAFFNVNTPQDLEEANRLDMECR